MAEIGCGWLWLAVIGCGWLWLTVLWLGVLCSLTLFALQNLHRDRGFLDAVFGCAAAEPGSFEHAGLVQAAVLHYCAAHQLQLPAGLGPPAREADAEAGEGGGGQQGARERASGSGAGGFILRMLFAIRYRVPPPPPPPSVAR